jgi:uncharacterized membrane protein YdjX (TVP38/TMEM64 family)
MTRRGALMVAAAALIITALVLIPAVRSEVVRWATHLTDREWIQQSIQSFGRAAPLVFIGLQIGQVVAAPVPGEATGIIGGYVFGAAWGFVYSSIGLALGSLVNFALGRLFGKGVVRRLVPEPAFQRFNHMVTHQGVIAVMIMFIIPGFPKDYLCLLVGLTAMPLKLFALIAGLGRMPGTLILSLQGASLYDQNYGLTVLLFVVCAAAVWLAHRYRERLYRWVEQINTPPGPPSQGPDDRRPSP